MTKAEYRNAKRRSTAANKKLQEQQKPLEQHWRGRKKVRKDRSAVHTENEKSKKELQELERQHIKCKKRSQRAKKKNKDIDEK